MGGRRLFRLLCSSVLLGAEAEPDIRVAKAHGDRGYNKVRISVVDEGKDDFGDFFDYNEKFQHAWTRWTLHSAVKDVPDGGHTFNIGGTDVKINLPKPGARARGLLIADLCFDSRGGGGCSFGPMWKIEDRFTKAVIDLVGSDEIDFWGILGDNLYENHNCGDPNNIACNGPVSKSFYEALPIKVKAKPFITVPGNHDFGQYGLGTTAPLDSKLDQGGYGFLQMYAQDVEFSLKGTAPYDFSKPIGGNVKDPNTYPTQDNYVFSHQIGDIAFLGWSGTAMQADFKPYLEKFCKWMEDAPTVNVAALVTHWNEDNLGCQALDGIDVYRMASSMNGCKDKQLLYFDGHQHCNFPHDEAPNNGFMIGGAGQWGGDGAGCPGQSEWTKARNIHQHWGFVVLDSDPSGPQKGNTSRVDYFEVQNSVGGPPYGTTPQNDYWANISACFAANPTTPYTSCRDAPNVFTWRSRPTPTPGPSPGPSPSPSSSPSGGPGAIIWVVAVIGVVVILGVIGGIVWRQKKMASAREAQLRQPMANGNAGVSLEQTA